MNCDLSGSPAARARAFAALCLLAGQSRQAAVQSFLCQEKVLSQNPMDRIRLHKHKRETSKGVYEDFRADVEVVDVRPQAEVGSTPKWWTPRERRRPSTDGRGVFLRPLKQAEQVT
jgi:hypothetical protein